MADFQWFWTDFGFAFGHHFGHILTFSVIGSVKKTRLDCSHDFVRLGIENEEISDVPTLEFMW